MRKLLLFLIPIVVSAQFTTYPPTTGGGGGSGTVTSVGLTLPSSLFSVSGSPVTTAGTLTAAYATGQTANLVFGTDGSGNVGLMNLTAAQLPAGIAFLANNQTFTGFNVFSASSAASQFGSNFSGTPFTGGTGTTTFPLVNIGNGAAVTSYSTSGTLLNLNAPSGFAGNAIDYHPNGAASSFSVSSNGSITNSGSLIVGGNSTLGGVISPQFTPATVAGSTSGTVTLNELFRGTAMKMVLVHLNSLVGTASYTFPSVFSFTPAVLIDSNTGGLTASVVTSLSTTAITVTGATSTGNIFLLGF